MEQIQSAPYAKSITCKSRTRDVTSKIFPKKILAYLELVKVFNSSKSTLYYGLCSFIGSLLAASWALPIEPSLAVASAITFSSFGIYALNDVYDARIDAINDRGRPIPSGRVTMREARVLATVLLVAGPAIAAAVNFEAFLCVLVFSILGMAYSMPPTRFKDGLFANVCWGLGIAAAILGGATVRVINASSMVAALTLACLTAGCGLTKDLKDLEGDKALNVPHFPSCLESREQ